MRFLWKLRKRAEHPNA